MLTPRIRIGNQTTYRVPAQLPYAFALEHGFDAFEWFNDKARGGWGEADTDASVRKALRQAALDNDVLFSVHVPVAADPVHSEGAQAIHSCLDFAHEVGARVVNVHLFPEHHSRVFADALLPLIERARSRGVQLVLENTPQTSPDAFNAVFGVLAAIPEAVGHVGMCLDMGHANLWPGTRNNYLRYVDLLGDHVPILHWHVHENRGDRDSHIPLFHGPAGEDDRGVRGLIARLGKRGFQGSVVLEQWPEPPEVLVQVRNRLQTLVQEVFASPDFARL